MDIIASVVQFFDEFEPKDWLTFTASIAAIMLSILSFRQKAHEVRLALRSQLTDLLEKLSDLNTEVAKFNYQREKKDEEYPPHYPRLLNDQRRFLVRQAAFVAAQIARLVSPYEYLVMAGAFDAVDDIFQAEHFYSVAASRASDLLDRGIAVRAYARFLFVQSRIPEGREQYARALDCFRGDVDRLKHFRGDTYERWAAQEFEWSNPTESHRLLELAIPEFESLSNPSRRRYEVERVRDLLAKSRDTTAATNT